MEKRGREERKRILGNSVIKIFLYIEDLETREYRINIRGKTWVREETTIMDDKKDRNFDDYEERFNVKHFDLAIDFGWFYFLTKPFFYALSWANDYLGNFGLAILAITVLVKIVFFPLANKSYKSMAKMRNLSPEIQKLRERVGDDRQKLNQEMMNLYKKEKVNPLGGCFPILLQMPIFIALYYALMESVELRHAPFMLWINDLSVMDPYYILPALMGASMFLIQKMSPTTVTDPMQQKVMQFMPVIFTVFFIWFPSGLVLYWLMSNVVTLIQQWIIFRSLEKKGLHTKKSKNKAK